MGAIVYYYFGWPDGAVWSNLLASVIWAAPTIWGLHRKLDRHHREHLAMTRNRENTDGQ